MAEWWSGSLEVLGWMVSGLLWEITLDPLCAIGCYRGLARPLVRNRHQIYLRPNGHKRFGAWTWKSVFITQSCEATENVAE